jgi:hypothetical protein
MQYRKVKRFYFRAVELLEMFPSLREARFRLVPARLSEEKFWSRFFTLLRERVLDTIILKNSEG